MAAQHVQEVPQAVAVTMVQGGQQVAKGVYAMRSQGVTITLKPGSRPGYVKVITVKGCAC